MIIPLTGTVFLKCVGHQKHAYSIWEQEDLSSVGGGGGVNVVKTLPLVTAILYKGKKQYPSLGQN